MKAPNWLQKKTMDLMHLSVLWYILNFSFCKITFEVIISFWLHVFQVLAWPQDRKWLQLSFLLTSCPLLSTCPSFPNWWQKRNLWVLNSQCHLQTCFIMQESWTHIKWYGRLRNKSYSNRRKYCLVGDYFHMQPWLHKQYLVVGSIHWFQVVY